MPRKTKQQLKNAIITWKAQFAGTCEKCGGTIRKGSLICRDANGYYIHYACHPDWVPAKWWLKVGKDQDGA